MFPGAILSLKGQIIFLLALAVTSERGFLIVRKPPAYTTGVQGIYSQLLLVWIGGRCLF